MFIRRSIGPTKNQRKGTMSKPTKTGKKKSIASSIVWFEIPADQPERAKAFYGKLFGWKIKKFPGMPDYWHIDTGGADDTADGGLRTRKLPGAPITNYISVESVTKSMAKGEKIG